MSGKSTNIKISTERFKNALKARGYSQKKISEVVNKRFNFKGQPVRDLRTLQNNLHDGEMNPNYLDKICQIIDVSPDYIIEAQYDSYMVIVSEVNNFVEENSTHYDLFEELRTFDSKGIRILPYEFLRIRKTIERAQDSLTAYLYLEVAPYIPHPRHSFIAGLSKKVSHFVQQEAIKELKRAEGEHNEKQK